MERIIYKPKIKRMFNLKNGICYLHLRGSIYFLEETKNKSIEFLRKFVNYGSKTPKEFYKIIHEDYLLKCEVTKKTNIKKKPFYVKLRIKRAKERIIKKIIELNQNIAKEEQNLKNLK